MDVSNAFVNFVIVTLPAILLYFLGWTYLYFYLSTFSIKISELKVDVDTVLVYGYRLLPAYRLLFIVLYVGFLLVVFTTLFDNL
jgi:hypothetical protein